MKFFIEDFFIKYDQIRSFLRIWSHLLKKYFTKNLIFCTAYIEYIKSSSILSTLSHQ